MYQIDLCVTLQEEFCTQQQWHTVVHLPAPCSQAPSATLARSGTHKVNTAMQQHPTGQQATKEPAVVSRESDSKYGGLYMTRNAAPRISMPEQARNQRERQPAQWSNPNAEDQPCTPCAQLHLASSKHTDNIGDCNN